MKKQQALYLPFNPMPKPGVSMYGTQNHYQAFDQKPERAADKGAGARNGQSYGGDQAKAQRSRDQGYDGSRQGQRYQEAESCKMMLNERSSSGPTGDGATSRGQGLNSSLGALNESLGALDFAQNSKPISVRQLDSRMTGGSFSSKNSFGNGEQDQTLNFTITSSGRGGVQKAPSPHPAPAMIPENHEEQSGNSLQLSESQSLQQTKSEQMEQQYLQMPKQQNQGHDLSYKTLNFELEASGFNGTYQTSKDVKQEYATVDQRAAVSNHGPQNNTKYHTKQNSIRISASHGNHRNGDQMQQQASFKGAANVSNQSSVMGSSQSKGILSQSSKSRQNRFDLLQPILKERKQAKPAAVGTPINRSTKRTNNHRHGIQPAPRQQQQKYEIQHQSTSNAPSIASNIFSKRITNQASYITAELTSSKLNESKEDNDTSFQQNSTFLMSQMNSIDQRELTGSENPNSEQMFSNKRPLHATQSDRNQCNQTRNYDQQNQLNQRINSNYNSTNSYQRVQTVDDFSTNRPARGNETLDAAQGREGASARFQPYEQTFRDQRGGRDGSRRSGPGEAAKACSFGYMPNGGSGAQGQMLNSDIMESQKSPDVQCASNELYSPNSPGQKSSQQSMYQPQKPEFYAQFMQQQQLQGPFMNNQGFSNTYGPHMHGFSGTFAGQNQFQNPNSFPQPGFLGNTPNPNFFQNAFNQMAPCQEYGGANTMSPSTLQNQMVNPQFQHPMIMNQALSAQNAYGQTMPAPQNHQRYNDITIGSQDLNSLPPDSAQRSQQNALQNMFERSKRSSQPQNVVQFHSQQSNQPNFDQISTFQQAQMLQNPILTQPLSPVVMNQRIGTSYSPQHYHQTGHPFFPQMTSSGYQTANDFSKQADQSQKGQRKSPSLTRKQKKSKRRSHEFRKDEILNILTKNYKPQVREFARTLDKSDDILKRSASAGRILKSALKRSQISRNMKVVKGRLVQRTVSPRIAKQQSSLILDSYCIPYTRFSKRATTSVKKRPPGQSFVADKGFKFKSFQDLRELLAYLDLQSYTHLFADKGLTHFTDFYLLNEEILRQILLPKPARKVLLAYQKFYRKHLLKMQKLRNQRASSAQVRRQHRERETSKTKTIQQPPMRFQPNTNNLWLNQKANPEFQMPLALESEMFQQISKLSKSHISAYPANTISNKSISAAMYQSKTPKHRNDVKYLKNSPDSRSRSKSGYRSQTSQNEPRNIFIQRHRGSQILLGSNCSQKSKKSKFSQVRSIKSKSFGKAISAEKCGNHHDQLISPSLRPQSIKAAKTKRTNDPKPAEKHVKIEKEAKIKKLMKELNKLVLGTEAGAQSTFQQSIASPSLTQCNSSTQNIDLWTLQNKQLINNSKLVNYNNQHLVNDKLVSNSKSRECNMMDQRPSYLSQVNHGNLTPAELQDAMTLQQEIDTANSHMNLIEESSNISQIQQSSQTLNETSYRNMYNKSFFNKNNSITNDKQMLMGWNQDSNDQAQVRRVQEQSEFLEISKEDELCSEVLVKMQQQEMPSTKRNVNGSQEYVMIQSERREDGSESMRHGQNAAQNRDYNINADLMGMCSARKYESVNHSEYMSSDPAGAYGPHQFEYTFQENLPHGDTYGYGEEPGQFEIYCQNQKQQAMKMQKNRNTDQQRQSRMTFDAKPLSYMDEPLGQLHNANSVPMTARYDSKGGVFSSRSQAPNSAYHSEQNYGQRPAQSQYNRHLPPQVHEQNQNRRSKSIDRHQAVPMPTLHAPEGLQENNILMNLDGDQNLHSDPRQCNIVLHDVEYNMNHDEYYNDDGNYEEEYNDKEYYDDGQRDPNNKYYQDGISQGYNHPYGDHEQMKENINTQEGDHYSQYFEQYDDYNSKSFRPSNTMRASTSSYKGYIDRVPPSYRKQTNRQYYQDQPMTKHYEQHLKRLHKPKFGEIRKAKAEPSTQNQKSSALAYGKNARDPGAEISYKKANQAFNKAKMDIENFHNRANDLRNRLSHFQP